MNKEIMVHIFFFYKHNNGTHFVDVQLVHIHCQT